MRPLGQTADRNLTSQFFISLHTDPPTRTQTGPLIYAEQTQTFPYIPTGAQTSVRPCDDHTGKQTTTLNRADSTRALNNRMLKHSDTVRKQRAPHKAEGKQWATSLEILLKWKVHVQCAFQQNLIGIALTVLYWNTVDLSALYGLTCGPKSRSSPMEVITGDETAPTSSPLWMANYGIKPHCSRKQDC